MWNFKACGRLADSIFDGRIFFRCPPKSRLLISCYVNLSNTYSKLANCVDAKMADGSLRRGPDVRFCFLSPFITPIYIWDSHFCHGISLEFHYGSSCQKNHSKAIFKKHLFLFLYVLFYISQIKFS